MKNLSKNKKFALFFISLTILATVFIFSNSLKVGEESSKQSDVIVNTVESIAKTVGVDFDRASLSHFIRKLGHFSEYFLLGSVCSAAIAFWFERRKFIVFAPIYSFIVAICDEFIFQNITQGRSPQFTDVLIDFSGALLAMVLVIAVFTFIIRRNKSKIQAQKNTK